MEGFLYLSEVGLNDLLRPEDSILLLIDLQSGQFTNVMRSHMIARFSTSLRQSVVTSNLIRQVELALSS